MKIKYLQNKDYKWAPRPLGPKEIDGLLVPSGKAYTLLTDHLITGYHPGLSLPRKGVPVKPSIHISLCGLLRWLYFKHLLDVMTSSFWVSLIKLPGMTLAVGWDIKHQFKQTKKDYKWFQYSFRVLNPLLLPFTRYRT